MLVEALRTGYLNELTKYFSDRIVSQLVEQNKENSAKVGTAIADIFGGPGEDAGLQYLITLKDIDTNLENVKGKAGELGVLQEEQLNSQMALQQSIANLFDATGGTF